MRNSTWHHNVDKLPRRRGSSVKKRKSLTGHGASGRLTSAYRDSVADHRECDCRKSAPSSIDRSPLLDDPPKSEADSTDASSEPESKDSVAIKTEELERLRDDVSRKLEALLGVENEPDSDGSTKFVTPRSLSEMPAKPTSPKVASMLSRLEELAAEEEAIRRRWNSIVYEVSPSSMPPVTTYENRQGTAHENLARTDNFTSHPPGTSHGNKDISVTGKVKERGEVPCDCKKGEVRRGKSRYNSHPKKDKVDLDVSMPLLSTSSLSSIQHCRDQYSKYRRNTGFDRWKMAEG